MNYDAMTMHDILALRDDEMCAIPREELARMGYAVAYWSDFRSDAERYAMRRLKTIVEQVLAEAEAAQRAAAAAAAQPRPPLVCRKCGCEFPARLNLGDHRGPVCPDCY